MQEMPVRSLGREDPLEEGMATHSSILAWRNPWTEEPCMLRSIGSYRVRHELKQLTTWYRTYFLATFIKFISICRCYAHTKIILWISGIKRERRNNKWGVPYIGMHSTTAERCNSSSSKSKSTGTWDFSSREHFSKVAKVFLSLWGGGVVERQFII